MEGAFAFQLRMSEPFGMSESPIREAVRNYHPSARFPDIRSASVSTTREKRAPKEKESIHVISEPINEIELQSLNTGNP